MILGSIFEHYWEHVFAIFCVIMNVHGRLLVGSWAQEAPKSSQNRGLFSNAPREVPRPLRRGAPGVILGAPR